MKKVLCFLGSIVLHSYALTGQSLKPYNVPEYSGKTPLVNRLQTFRSQIKADTNQALINLQSFIPHLKLDIRYATTNNFMHAKMYSLPMAFLRKPAAKALYQINLELNKKGIGLIIYDAYRPYSITVKFYKMVGDSTFVASPRRGSKHNRGCAVDLGLYDLQSGNSLEMPTPFDSFSKLAAANYTNLPKKALDDRRLLASTMVKYGFNTIESEWWHFDFKDWAKFNVLDISFEKLSRRF